MLKILLIMFFASILNAHSLKGFAKQEGEFVEIKSYFYGNSPCKNCPVSFIKDGARIGVAQTDENGFARVKIPADEFEILIDGGLAHEKRIKFTVHKEEPKSAESNAPGDDSKVKFDESEEDFWAYALKFILAFAGIGLFFGGIYLVKRGK
ncbi:MAG: hypothetical protein ACTTJF_05395 [Campylobacter sp.]|uniref:hypothetical protein n=1 Tax=Campylobacter sp. TaxID=205 RepID=UPI003F9F21A9